MNERTNTRTLFVYGTLMRGLYNHRVLGASARFIGCAKLDGFTMGSFGSFPGITRDPHEKVVGEVWEIDEAQLASVDALEGHPHFYKREEVLATLDDGSTLNVEVYTLNARQFPHDQPVRGNNWRNEVALRQLIERGSR